MEKVDLCFIGAGFHATTNIYPSAVEAGINIKAIATRDIERSKKALLKAGSCGRAYDNHLEMLIKEQCDGVVIVAQPKDQFQITLDSINLGKNVFVEKPLGWNEAEARIIYEAAKKQQVSVMVGFMKRFAPCYSRIKEIIDSNELGRPRSFTTNFAVDSTAFCKNDEEFIKLAAVHILDLVRFLFGEAVEVKGVSSSKAENISQCLSLKFESGVVGSLYFSGMNAWSRESENITITFDNGFVQSVEINKLIVHRSKESRELSYASHTEEDRIYTPSATPMSGAYRDLYLRGFIGELKHFICCIKNKQEPLSNAEANIFTMRLCEEVLKAIV